MNPEDVKALLPPSVVENLLGPASDAIGKTLGGVLYGIFQWPIKYGIVKKAEFDDLAYRTSQKYKEIPQQNRTSEKAGLALKALEESKYQLNEKELREMFAQLIANSFDNRITPRISPRFSTILSQLSSLDADFFKFIATEYQNTVVYGYFIQHDNDHWGPYRNISLKYYDSSRKFGKKMLGSFPTESVDTLSSLGIIKEDEMSIPAAPIFNEKYTELEQRIRHSIFETIPDNELVEFQKGCVRLTSFGKDFANCVL